MNNKVFLFYLSKAMHMYAIIGFFILICLPGGVIGASSLDLSSSSEKELDSEWDAMKKGWNKIETRTLMDFVLEAVPLHWHPERIDEVIVKLQELQDRDPKSETYGNFRWFAWQSKPVDLNAGEFVMQRAILVWNLHRDELNAASADGLSKMINLSVEGIERHKVDIDYTNIILMKIWNLIAIGEAFNRKDVANQGYQLFQEWKQAVDQHGIHEFMSPTYTGVQLNSLVLLDKFASREQERKLAQQALKLLYWQCLANLFAPDERLGGAHSRDYDYLQGHGNLDQYLSNWGLGHARTKPVLHTLFDLVSWRPKNMMESDLSTIPRYVQERWGKLPEQCATQFIDKNISIGVSGCSYGQEDKVFAINFSGGPQMPMAIFFMDGRGDPYGKNKVKLGDGHTKAHHLTPFIVSAQNGPDVLFLSSEGLSQTDAPNCLYSHLDIPMQVSVWQGDQKLDAAPGRQIPLVLNKPIFLRYRDTAVGFYCTATDDSGKEIAPTYYRDGDKYNAARISWCHSPNSPQGEAHVLFWTKVAENLDNTGFEQFRDKFSQANIVLANANGKISASVQSDKTKLSVEADLNTKTSKTNPTSLSGIFQVNHQELSLF